MRPKTVPLNGEDKRTSVRLERRTLALVQVENPNEGRPGTRKAIRSAKT